MKKNTAIFLDVLERHKGIIYKIANSYCKAREDRQDLIQEIIIQLWQSFEKYNEQFKLATWIYRIALSTAISFYRKNKTYKQKTTGLPAMLETSLKANKPFQEDTDISTLQGFIQELREIDKALIVLYLDGLSQKEIANIMGITPTNVGTKIARIKKTLKQKFQTLKK